jgi:hypothetical protein
VADNVYSVVLTSRDIEVELRNTPDIVFATEAEKEPSS